MIHQIESIHSIQSIRNQFPLDFCSDVFYFEKRMNEVVAYNANALTWNIRAFSGYQMMRIFPIMENNKRNRA